MDKSAPGVSKTPLNLWRRYPYEPAARAYFRGSFACLAFTILIAFAVYTIGAAANKNSFYATRTYSNPGVIPQPHLFTNHCNSAMAVGGDQDAFAALIAAQPVCTDGHFLVTMDNCSAVWYNASVGFQRDIARFKEFYAEEDTEVCLAFECTPCSDTQGHGWHWDSVTVTHSFPPVDANGSLWRADRADHIGTTAVWPWRKTPPENGRDRKLPFDVSGLPFLVRNGSHYLTEVTYSENGRSSSNTFRDFIGLPNVIWETGDYVAATTVLVRRDYLSNSADGSLVMDAPPWPGWSSNRMYTTTTLPGLVGTLGGLWTSVTGIIALIFGTSAAFLLFGSKPISVGPPFPWGRQAAVHNLDQRYFTPGRPVDAEARLHALVAFLADYVIDAKELDLSIGRIPGSTTKEETVRCESSVEKISPVETKESA